MIIQWKIIRQQLSFLVIVRSDGGTICIGDIMLVVGVGIGTADEDGNHHHVDVAKHFEYRTVIDQKCLK